MARSSLALFSAAVLLVLALTACEDADLAAADQDDGIGGAVGRVVDAADAGPDCVVLDRSTAEVLPAVWLTWASALLCAEAPNTGDYAVTVTVENQATSAEAVRLDDLAVQQTTPRPGGEAPAATAATNDLPAVVAVGEAERITVRGRYELVQTDEGKKANLHLHLRGEGVDSERRVVLAINLFLRAPGARDGGRVLPTTPHAATDGALLLCKAAPDAAGREDIRFTVEETSLIVPAGFCRLRALPAGATVTIEEHSPPGRRVTAIAVQPAERLVQQNVAAGAVRVRVGEGVTAVTFTNARQPAGHEGCSPGFFKNHPGVWVGYEPDQRVASVFPTVAPQLGDQSLRWALDGGGGPGLVGGERILLRAAVAALLNAAHPEIAYPLTVTEVHDEVEAALAARSRSRLLDLAERLDALNNRGCPIDD